jgi:hypothetical protein
MPNERILKKSEMILSLIIFSVLAWGDEKKTSAALPPTQPTPRAVRASDAVVRAMLEGVTIADAASETPVIEQVTPEPSTVTKIVPANQPWTATGINLKQGELFTVTASGGVAFSVGSPPEDPGGDPHDCLTLANGPSGWRARPFLANNLPCFSLVGRVGERGPIFEIGTGKTLKSQSSGQLYLGVNDNYFPDNSGSWTANISVGPGGAATPNAISARGQGLTDDDIIKLVQVKLPDSLIIAKIKSSACAFDTSPDGLDKLRQAGVSNAVVLAMLKAGVKLSTSAPTPPTIRLFQPQVSGLTVSINGVTSPTTPGATVRSIGWSFGDGTPSINSWFPTQHKFPRSGSFLVTVVAKDSNGLATSTTINVTVAGAAGANPTPLARAGNKVSIQILNEQATETPAPFAQQLIVDSSRFAEFEADNLQNVQFYDQTGRVIPSWLESGNLRSATRTIYWLRLASGVPANRAMTVFMEFSPPTENMFDGVTTGEAPGLSSEYGQYDNGKQVFTRYANFVGTSLPAGWSRSVTPGSRGAVAISNGGRIWHSGTGGGASFLGSDWRVQANVAEMHVLSEMTNNGQDMVMFCTSSPREDAWVPGSVGYQNGSGLEVEGNQSGKPSVLSTAVPDPMLPAVIGLQGNIVYANYEPVITMAGPICGGRYLASWANTGFDASFSFDWVRLRPAAPGNVMPKTVF